MAEQNPPWLSQAQARRISDPSSSSLGGSTIKQKRKDEIQSLEPRAYADAVAAHSSLSISDSLYPGNAFSSLASYLRSPYERYARDLTQLTINVPEPATNVSDPQRPCFATLYDFSLNTAKKAVHLHDIERLNELDEASSRNKGRAQILFLNGHPSPQWLNAIVGRFCVDPEFYQRHLDFRAAISRPDYFTLPALPSASETMARLRITTIGYRQPRLGFSAHQHPQRYLDRLRSEATKGMTQYENTLRMEDKWKTGDSIVRDFAIHDIEHFTIEQDISICIDRIEHGWIAVVWLDFGATLQASPHGPWISPKKHIEDHIEFLPTMQQKTKIAPKNSSNDRGQIVHTTATTEISSKVDLFFISTTAVN